MKVFYKFILAIFLISLLSNKLISQNEGTYYHPGELKFKSDKPLSMEDFYRDPPNVASCKEGYLKESEIQKVLELVNYIRSLHNLYPVTYQYDDDEISAKTSLIMSAEGTITHFPPASSSCYTEMGATGAEKSNLHINMYGEANPSSLATCESAIIGWLFDTYSSNPEKVGHRRAIINPFLKYFSLGRCDGKPNVPSQWAYVTTMSFKFINPITQDLTYWQDDFVAYPYQNYPPELFEKSFYLSFSAIFDKGTWSKNSVDYSAATIEITDENGNQINIHSKDSDNEGWGAVVNCLVWKADNLQDFVRYNVKIKNVKFGSQTRDYEYWFKLGEAGPPRLMTPQLVEPANYSKKTATTVLLKWNSVPDATRYQLQVANNASFTNPIIDEKQLTDLEYELNDLEKGAVYYWRVKAFNDKQESNFSEIWNFGTKEASTKPNAPLLLTPADNETGLSLTTLFTWGSITGTQGYYFQLATNASFTESALLIDEDLSSPAYKVPSDKKLSPNTQYFWRIKAYGNYGEFTETEWSDPRSFTTIVASISEQEKNGFSITNYPNPFSGNCLFNITSPVNATALLVFYDELGATVATKSIYLNENENAFHFNFDNLPQGVYFYVLKCGETSIFNKMQILK